MANKGSGFTIRDETSMPSSAFQTRAKEKSHLYTTAGSTDTVISRWENNVTQYPFYLCWLGVAGTRERLLGFLKQCLEHFPCKVISICFNLFGIKNQRDQLKMKNRLKTKGINLTSHILPPQSSNSLPRERSQRCISDQTFWAWSFSAPPG